VGDFTPARHKFEGVIGGTPCQDFSGARRCAPTGAGDAALKQFARCVTQAAPKWFLLENVLRVPDLIVPGYKIQRFNLNANECGSRQSRPRCFQFGSVSGQALVIRRMSRQPGASHCCLATEANKPGRRTFADFCELQGLPRDFDLPGLSVAMKYRLVGNGVQVDMARVVATAIRDRAVTRKARLCVCECGREVFFQRTMATAACRKRMQRAREESRLIHAGSVT
jgi:DNA (cytosine-5)-methyltransferase 1